MSISDYVDERVARLFISNPRNIFSDKQIKRYNEICVKLAEEREKGGKQMGYYVKCEICGRQVNLNARRTAAYKTTGHFVCGECKGIREKALEQLAAREEYLSARREAYHRGRALRHGGAKLRKGRSRKRSGD